MADTLQCFFCKQLVDGYVEGLKRHIKLHVDRNEFDKNLIYYTCMKKGCRISYRKYSNLKQHIIKNHPLTSARKNRVGCQMKLREEESVTDFVADENIPTNPDVTNDYHSEGSVSDDYNFTMDTLRNFAAISICKLASDVSFTESNIKKCISLCEDIIDQVNQFVGERADRFIQNMVPKISSQEVVEFQNELCITNLFEDVQTPARQKKFLEKQIGFIPEPRTIMLQERDSKKFIDGIGTSVKVILR